MKERKAIQRVIPIDWGELLIQFEHNEVRSFDSSKHNLYEDYKFLAYPDRLRSYSFNESQIKWYNGTVFSANFLFEHAEELENDKLRWKSLSLGRKNRAPTAQHISHHVYNVAIRPYNQEMPIALSESIGGGIADMGGSRSIDLEEAKDYRDHFKLSNCLWAYEILLKQEYKFDQLIDYLVEEFLRRTYK